MSVLPDPGASRAVLIGTSRYDHLEQLPAVSNNLTALAELLGGPLSLRIPASHLAVIENPPTPSAVMEPLRQAAAEATDTLIVYYAGHGLIDPHDTLALAMPYTQPDHIETSLDYDWLRQTLLNSRAQRHIVLLDCCYSGLALGRMSGPQSLADHAAVEGTFLLAASAETRTALAPIGDTHTAFTGALLETLNHGIPGGPPLLDLETVYLHLRRTLEARAHPVPQARNRNSGSRVALGRNPSDLPAAPLPGAADPRQPDYRLWPDPSAISTVIGFFTNLATVREVSGLTQREVSTRSAGRISTGTISKLVNGDTLPTTWTSTAAYLSACGVPDDQIQLWHGAWQELRRNAPAAQQRTATPGGSTTEAGKARRRLSALWRGRGH
ncbi:caspase family protein [Streptomyces sp. KA12]|uniref:caspase, EACC1-associated type n=1 Tax=Streptomyces sp. KA12 TaxID=2991730 RepID=UPI0023AEB01C|nr:caspase family protein [Streptomyces sp. KA12]MDF0376585.1 caspase family protein [Streptomyces sp. KA12]